MRLMGTETGSRFCIKTYYMLCLKIPYSVIECFAGLIYNRNAALEGSQRQTFYILVFNAFNEHIRQRYWGYL